MLNSYTKFDDRQNRLRIVAESVRLTQVCNGVLAHGVMVAVPSITSDASSLTTEYPEAAIVSFV